MSPNTQHRIYLALLIAVILGCGLYFIGREATPLGFGTTTHTYWTDELNDWYGTASWNGVAPPSVGAALSQLHPLHDIEPGYGYFLATAPDGRILASNYPDIFIFEPARNRFQRSKIPFRWNLFVGLSLSSNGKLYGIAHASANKYTGAFADQQDRLFEFDPDTGQTQIVPTVISDTRYILADNHNRILGFRAGLWPAWTYDTVSAQFLSPATADQRERYWQDRPVLGNDGLIYGTYSASLGGQNVGAALDLEQHTLITRELFGGWWPTVTARPGRGAYVNSENYGTWLFNPAANELTQLQLPSAHPVSRFNIQVATPAGWLYGRGTYNAPNTTFVFAYQPESNRFKSFALTNWEWIPAMTVGPDQQLYAIALSNDKWQKPRLLVITDTYVSSGTLTTTSIKPIALVLTQTWSATPAPRRAL